MQNVFFLKKETTEKESPSCGLDLSTMSILKGQSSANG